MSTTFTLGELTIHRIIEQESPFEDPLTFFPALTRQQLDENRSWLEPAALDPATGKMNFCFQSYVVRTPHHTILVDSCIGNDKDRATRPLWHMKRDDTFMRGLATAGLTPADIDVVMCTHLHVDHVGWNTRLDNGRWVPTFPNARYLFSEREYAYWADQHAKTPIACIADSVIPIVDAKRADFVTSDHALDDHVRLLPTPGHTPDHFAVLLGRATPNAILTGDLIHSPIQARYPEISMRADTDPAQSAATRRSFLERVSEARTLCCTAHFPSPSTTRFTRWGDGFRCEPA
ncbi:MAG TPA: MBL fold metallo-hydrolase [Acetobacteraceae bacterium]|nr:MBL fold metallo-hydrolase [Acetobacteraceae bacterium]